MPLQKVSVLPAEADPNTFATAKMLAVGGLTHAAYRMAGIETYWT